MPEELAQSSSVKQPRNTKRTKISQNYSEKKRREINPVE